MVETGCWRRILKESNRYGLLLLALLDPEDGGTTLFRNVDVYQSTRRNMPKDLNIQ